jgi:hypothetical protein
MSFVLVAIARSLHPMGIPSGAIEIVSSIEALTSRALSITPRTPVEGEARDFDVAPFLSPH